MNVNELIKEAMLGYKQAQESDKTAAKKRIDILKLVKTAFMEYATNKKNATQFDEADDVSVRITKIDELQQNKIIEDMIKVRKNNVKTYSEVGRSELANNEQDEIDVLETLLPKAATEEDIVEYLKQYYPNGTEKKFMGAIIKEVKSAFERVDGSLVSKCVMSIVS